MSKEIAVIGLGNILLKDERLGIHVVRELKKDPRISESVAIIEAGIPGLGILDILEGYKKALIVDIAPLGGKPGTVYVFKIRRDETGRSPLKTASLHEVDFLTPTETGWSVGLAIPAEMTVIAVESQDYQNYGLELTPEVAEALPRVLSEIRKQIESINIH